MGLFTPGWKKDPNKAKKALKTKSISTLKKIAEGADFPDPQGLRIRYEAVHAIRFIDEPGQLTAFLEMAQNAPFAHVRCHAAHELALKGSDKGRELVAANIVEAYREQGNTYCYGAQDWIRDVKSSPEIVFAAFQAAQQKDLKEKILDEIRDHEHLFWIAMNDSSFASAAMAKFTATQEQYVKLIRETSSEGLKNQAIRKLDLSQERLLLELAESGNQTAKTRLLDLDTRRFARKFADEMSWEQYKKAIASDLYSQEELEKIAAEFKSISRDNPAWHALSKITEPERLERLLYREIPLYETQKGGNWSSWVMTILKKLKDDEDVMLKFIISKHGGKQAETESYALANIKSPDKIRKVAMTSSHAALDAAKRLGSEDIPKLRESENGGVREWADQRFVEQMAGKASEEEALEMMDLIFRYRMGGGQFRRALRRVKSQQGLVTAYTKLNKAYKPFGNDDEAIRTEIRSQITDGAAFLSWCQDNTYRMLPEDSALLHELIAGTETEQQMKQAAIDRLLKRTMDTGDTFGMNLLAKYDGITPAEATWKYAGKDYVRKLVSVLNTSKEDGPALQAIQSLKWLYQNVPESQSLLASQKGRILTKHDDYHDESCGSNSRSREVTVTVKLD